MGISEQEERGSAYCTSCALRVNCGDSTHVVLFLKKRDSYCERQQRGARLLSPPAEGGGRSHLAALLWDSSAEWHLFHLTPAGCCDKNVPNCCSRSCLLLLLFLLVLLFFFFSWFRSLRWGSFKCETTSVGGDGENRPPPACQKTLLLLPANKVWRIKVMINNNIAEKKTKLQKDVGRPRPRRRGYF